MPEKDIDYFEIILRGVCGIIKEMTSGVVTCSVVFFKT